VLRVQWQNALQPLDQIGEQETENAEREKTRRILRPALLGVFPDAAQLVDDAFLRLPSNTLYMNSPTGFVMANTIAK
jgi:hypothetical protein